MQERLPVPAAWAVVAWKESLKLTLPAVGISAKFKLLSPGAEQLEMYSLFPDAAHTSPFAMQ